MIVAMIILYSLIGTVSVVGNFIVLLVVYKSKKLRHSQYVYNCSIAISDIIWGLATSYFSIYSFVELLELDPISLEEEHPFKHFSYDKYTLPEVYKDENNITNFKYELDYVELSIMSVFNTVIIMYVLVLLTPVTLLVSFISLLFSSIDRYVALTFPFKYKQINSIKIAKIVSVFVWIFSATVNTVTFYVFFYERQTNLPLLFQPATKFNTASLNQRIIATILFILFSLLWTLTFLTLCNLYKSYKRSSLLKRSTKKSLSLEKQMSLILIAMVVAFTFSLFPTIYFNFFYYIDNDYSYLSIVQKNFIVSVAFLATNSIWNFIIYNILNKKFRFALINVCFKCK